MTYKAPTVLAGTSGQAAAASVSIARPALLKPGDLLVLVVASEKLATGITVPTGFIPICAELTENGAVNLKCWYKFATHTEPATYTYTLALGDDSLYNLFLVRGVDPRDVIHVTDSAQGSATLPRPEPGITTTVNNCLAVAVLVYDDSPRLLVQPVGWTLLDSDDGPLHAICFAIATKVLAGAGSSGGADWTATDSTANDYIALTFAITPGVMGRGETYLYYPQVLLAKTLADCTEFRNLAGAADHASALARIWFERLPPPASGAEKYSLAELEAYRPFALVYLRDPDGSRATRQAISPATWADSGSLWVHIVISTPEELEDDPLLLDQFVKQTIGRILLRPPDEEAASFDALLNLAHTTNAVGGYSYLAADDAIFRGWFQSRRCDEPDQGGFVTATIEVQWGGRGG